MTQQTEEWRVVPNLDGRYLVSSSGKVKSTARCVFRKNKKGENSFNNPQTVKEKLLKGCITHDGYHLVRLSAEGCERNYFVHSLVAQAFIVKPDYAECVNHIDGNKLNNHVFNLEWVTLAENSRHGWRTGLYETNKRTQFKAEKLSYKDFDKIKQLYSSGMRQKDIAKRYGIARTYVSLIVNNKVRGSQLSLPFI